MPVTCEIPEDPLGGSFGRRFSAPRPRGSLGVVWGSAVPDAHRPEAACCFEGSGAGPGGPAPLWPKRGHEGWGQGCSGGAGCTQKPTEILFPTSGNILQIQGRGWEAARPKSTEADLPEFGRTGSKPPFQGLDGTRQACSANQPLLHYCGSRHSPTESLKLLNTVSHRPRGAGFTKSRASATAAKAGLQPALPGRQSARGDLFLLGDADLGLAAQDMPPPACFGQGRKGLQLKDKTLFTQAMQRPQGSASSEETLPPSGPPRKHGPVAGNHRF